MMASTEPPLGEGTVRETCPAGRAPRSSAHSSRSNGCWGLSKGCLGSQLQRCSHSSRYSSCSLWGHRKDPGDTGMSRDGKQRGGSSLLWDLPQATKTLLSLLCGRGLGAGRDFGERDKTNSKALYNTLWDALETRPGRASEGLYHSLHAKVSYSLATCTQRRDEEVKDSSGVKGNPFSTGRAAALHHLLQPSLTPAVLWICSLQAGTGVAGSYKGSI